MHYSDSMLLPYPCEQVFDMVADIERYPEFLPGWTDARIVQGNEECLRVEQQLQAGPAVFRFHSTARMVRCSDIRITASDGPFRNLSIHWKFSPVADDRCRVAVDLELTMKPGPANGALQLLLEAGGSKLLPLFDRRARLLYSRA